MLSCLIWNSRHANSKNHIISFKPVTSHHIWKDKVREFHWDNLQSSVLPLFPRHDILPFYFHNPFNIFFTFSQNFYWSGCFDSNQWSLQTFIPERSALTVISLVILYILSFLLDSLIWGSQHGKKDYSVSSLA